MNVMADPHADRKAWMSLLAKAPAADLARLWGGVEAPDYTFLRPPEIGGVMVRGRAGAVGAAFNLGEMTVTRCSLKLACGTVGHAYVQGRNKDHAVRAALIDALMLTDRADDIRRAVLTPLEQALTATKARRAAKAAATKVDFFTVARGED
ncbi:phosphonate C-P lyase system protein PhnG [Cognatiyoonia sp. IB215182]|uniref:phosphonate C-P lyase system protein PhnG n=1 Tax=Cognatiyoonia sp. IB215182 TaxID=3097353 RepID=UPI002A162D5C|nr:phosphonate C-P lyase system protein PhnG [Cognatiyoonia sp. IB215182]MDX8351840.1 phosphonate C-P lyase system protein PhnG [Cognatiyoonia sp. IB215182]